MSVQDLPSLLYEFSRLETAVLLISALIGLITIPFMARRNTSKVVRTAVAGIAIILLLYSVSSLLSGLSLEHQPPHPGSQAVRNAVHSVSNTLSSFYSTPMGMLLGSAGLAVIKIVAAAFPLGIVYLLIRGRFSVGKDRKRCSNCHTIFPPHTQPHRHCPHCGTYWKYEK
jgi:hypothetical protein